MTSDTAVLAEDLTKFYGQRRGIEGLTLEVRAGEVMGFLGPNGAGKTTHHHPATTGFPTPDLRPRNRARARPATGQGGPAPTDRLPPRRAGVPGREKAADLLRFFGDARGGVAWSQVTDLAERLDLDLSRPVSTMSKGNKQKAGLVQAFMHQPALLILDEPTSGLDPLMQQEFLAMVRDARDAGQTVFMSSHVLTEVQAGRRPGGHRPRRQAGRGGAGGVARQAGRPVGGDPLRRPGRSGGVQRPARAE